MTNPNLLEQYKAKLTTAQAARGIQAAEKNARDLLDDAEILYKHKKWSRACALAILAVEEASKPALLRGVILADNEDDLRKAWRHYRSHLQKNVTWIFNQLVAEGGRKLDDFRTIFDKKSHHPATMEALKQIAIYTDAYGDCHWSIPKEIIDEGTARSTISIAKSTAHGRPVAMSTEAELDLWIKHLKPVWKAGLQEKKSALLACYHEAQETGVLSGKHTAEEMTQFLGLE